MEQQALCNTVGLRMRHSGFVFVGHVPGCVYSDSLGPAARDKELGFCSSQGAPVPVSLEARERLREGCDPISVNAP